MSSLPRISPQMHSAAGAVWKGADLVQRKKWAKDVTALTTCNEQLKIHANLRGPVGLTNIRQPPCSVTRAEEVITAEVEMLHYRCRYLVPPLDLDICRCATVAHSIINTD